MQSFFVDDGDGDGDGDGLGLASGFGLGALPGVVVGPGCPGGEDLAGDETALPLPSGPGRVAVLDGAFDVAAGDDEN